MDEEQPAGPPEPDEPPLEQDPGDTGARRSHIEGLLRESLRRALERGLEAGLGTLSKTDKAIRGVVGGDVPRELASYLFSQVDDTKNALVRVVAREVRDFLDATDLADELQRALTALSFEVRTEIRFVPNEAGGVRPSVKTKGKPRRKESERPRSERPKSERPMSQGPAAGSEEEDPQP